LVLGGVRLNDTFHKYRGVNPNSMVIYEMRTRIPRPRINTNKIKTRYNSFSFPLSSLIII
jgi:hypothetical protein